MKRDVATLALAFGGGTALAALLGADSFGIALGVGQVTFALALIAVLLRP